MPGCRLIQATSPSSGSGGLMHGMRSMRAVGLASTSLVQAHGSTIHSGGGNPHRHRDSHQGFFTSHLRPGPSSMGGHHLMLGREDTRDPPPSTSTSCRAIASSAASTELEPDEQMRRELHSLNVAIGANGLIFLLKIWVHLITGSSSLLAEALHSIADILNQALLRVGVLQSRQGPTKQFNYGYHRDRFIWSLISAVGIFFLGAGASVFHGIHMLTSEHQIEGLFWTYAVLGISGLLEGYSLHVALKSVREGAAARGMTPWNYIKSGVDPTTVAVVMEDGGAIMGLVIAAVSTALTHATGVAMWDACGSIGIGLLLGGIATFLVSKNRQLLIGRSMAQDEMAQVTLLLRKDPVVAYILDCKTEEIGPRVFRFKAEVAWDGEILAERYLARVGRDRLVKRLQAVLSAQPQDPAAIDKVLRLYGKGIISAVGAEVDRLETEIQTLNPAIRFVDLETDRGRVAVRKSGGGGPSMSSYDGDLMGDYDPGPISEYEQTAEGREAERKGATSGRHTH